jgi:hypothetical protein
MRQLILLTFILCFSFALAQDAQAGLTIIPFQGQIRNQAGDLLPDTSIYMVFRFYSDSTGGIPLWSESHPGVSVKSGIFKEDLGIINPCSLSIFDSGGSIYLETQIGDDALPLGQRIRLGTAPMAGSSQRISGDVVTSPGMIRMFAPQPEPPGAPTMEMNTSIGGDASIHMFAPQPEPPGEPEDILSINSSPTTGGSIKMFAPQPEPPGEPIMEMASGPGGEASIRMFAPQPEPPGSPLLELNTGISNGATIRMFAPQPEPPGEPSFLVNTNSDGGARLGLSAVSGSYSQKLIDLRSNLSGGNLELFAPQAGGTILVNNHPQIRLRCDSTVSNFLIQRSRTIIGPIPYDSTGISLRSDSLNSAFSMFCNNYPALIHSATSSGGRSSYFTGGTEYMGIDPMPFGGALSMFENDGDTAIQIASDGSASFFNDGTEYMGIDPAPFGGSLKMLASDGRAEITLSSEGKLSIGTSNDNNIITVVRFSATDPIADAWTVYSSRRWKTNIQPIQNALDKVMRLNGVTYDWIENGKHDIGFIAEDVGQVIPEVVAYEDNGIDAKSVDYARLTSILVESVKELQKEVELLKADNVSANQKIAKLEEMISKSEKK